MVTVDRFVLKMLIYVYIAVGGFLIGYVIGRIESLHDRLRRIEGIEQPLQHDLKKPNRWFTQTSARPPAAPISIDDSKFVTEVSTAGLEKPAEVALGEKQTVQDDINAAASRLAHLKRS